MPNDTATGPIVADATPHATPTAGTATSPPVAGCARPQPRTLMRVAAALAGFAIAAFVWIWDDLLLAAPVIGITAIHPAYGLAAGFVLCLIANLPASFAAVALIRRARQSAPDAAADRADVAPEPPATKMETPIGPEPEPAAGTSPRPTGRLLDRVIGFLSHRRSGMTMLYGVSALAGPHPPLAAIAAAGGRTNAQLRSLAVSHTAVYSASFSLTYVLVGVGIWD